MDQITFQYDTVLSDVHMHKPNAGHLMARLNAAGQPVFVSRFKILTRRPERSDSVKGSKGERGLFRDPAAEGEGEDGEDEEEEAEERGEPKLDEDGDLDITNRPRKNQEEVRGRDLVCPVILRHWDAEAEGEREDDEEGEQQEQEEEESLSKDVLRIEHTMATPLEDVGKQVWRGALFMADFILSQPELFRGATVLELGAGTGLTSIILAASARTVYCTDVGEDLLSLCRRNVALNKRWMESGDGEVKVRQLDWLQRSLCTDADVEFSWTEEEVADLYDNTSFIMAADVCYDDDLTDGLFRTLQQLCSHFSRPCTVFISMEKRMNFSLRLMDVCCEAYTHFQRCLSQLQQQQQQQQQGSRCCFRVERVASNFGQFLLYERVEQLELWRITSTPSRPSSSTSLSSPAASVPACPTCTSAAEG